MNIDGALQSLDKATAYCAGGRLNKAKHFAEKSIRLHRTEAAVEFLARVETELTKSAAAPQPAEAAQPAAKPPTLAKSAAAPQPAEAAQPAAKPPTTFDPAQLARWVPSQHAIAAPIAAAAFAFVSMASTRGAVPPSVLRFVAGVPLLVCVGAFGTCMVCYPLWRYGPRGPADKRVLFPAISEMGVGGAEQRVYQVGFATVGLLVAVTMAIFERLVVPHLVAHHQPGLLKAAIAAAGRAPTAPGAAPETVMSLAKAVTQTGMMVALGVGMQGVFTLQHKISPQSLVHWAGAGVFAYYAMQHTQIVRILFECATPERDADNAAAGWALLASSDDTKEGAAMRFAIAMRKGLLDKAPLLMFAIPIAFQVLVASRFTSAEPEGEAAKAAAAQQGSPAMQNIMGAMQWMVIGQFAVYVVFYALDFYACAALPLPAGGAL